MKKSQKVLKKYIKEALSVLLCFVLILGTFTIPAKVTAAGSSPKSNEYVFDSSTPSFSDRYVFPGDVFVPESYVDEYNRYYASGFSIRYRTLVPYVVNYTYDYDLKYENYTVPLKIASDHEYSSYIYYVYTDGRYVDDDRTPTTNYFNLKFDAWPGFQIIYYDAAGNALNSWGSHFYFLDTNGGGEVGVSANMSSDFEVERAYDDTLGEQIGWSVSSDYMDSTESSGVLYVAAEEGPAMLYDDNLFAVCMNNTQNGILNLYPVFYLAPSTLSISAEDFEEGQELPLSIDSNRTDDYSLKYEKKNSDGTYTAISAAPTTAGDYRVTVIYPETETLLVEGDYSMEIEQRGYTAISDSAEFSILSNASVSTKPAANSLTYNGTSQALVTEGKASGGEVLYSLSKDGEYTATVPSAKDAGKYTVWYMVKGADGRADISPASIDVTIAPKTVGLVWSGTSYEYDGASHCPSAAVTGLCDGDSCDVTVSGAQTEAGTYTATATALSNSNYALPSANTTEFTITQKPEEKKEEPEEKQEEPEENNEEIVEEEEEKDPEKSEGKVSVSMAGFYYGGTATSPVITSSTNDIRNAKVSYKAAGSGDGSYSPSVPTEVGRYIVKVTLPANDKYNACSATAEFSISYLPTPANAYSINGSNGEDGWYKSDVVITPANGYQISYGDRNHFSNNSIKIEKNVNQIYVYLRDASTYEQTDVIVINGFKIDKQSPEVEDMTSGEIYFADESGNVTCIVSDENLSHVVINGNKVKLTDLGNGRKSFTVPAGAKKETVSFTAYDLAGNKTDFSLTTAPSWKRNGVISEGEIYLEAGEKFTIPEGKWVVDGDDTVYYGGTIFYASKEGMYTFKKK